MYGTQQAITKRVRRIVDPVEAAAALAVAVVRRAERKERSRPRANDLELKHKPRIDPAQPDISHRSRLIEEITAHLERLATPDPSAVLVKAANRLIRKTERKAGDGTEIGGTGSTSLRLRQKPIPKLIDEGKIGNEEIQAADEISLAFYALSSRLMIRGIDYDRVDSGRGTDAPWPARTAHAVKRYQRFSTLWSDRSKQYGDPTLEILIAAVIDERPIRAIAADLGYRPARIERALIGGLRDYAVRAGLVAGHAAQGWMDAAEAVFGPSSPTLHAAVRRARVEA